VSTANGTGTRAQAALARNDYREGQILRARDLERESGYFLARDRQHAALAHIPGILHGLRLNVFERGTETVVTEKILAEKGSMPLDLFVESGVAVDAHGRLVGLARREQVRTDLATTPSVLPAGRYRIVLLYERVADGAGNGESADPCAEITAGTGGGRTVRERGIIRLRDADEELPAAPTPGALVDGPSDRTEDEAPVVLGTVLWNGQDAFVGFSVVERRYAGVTAQEVATPDEQARIDLNRGLAVHLTAPPARPEDTPRMHDVLRVDPEGRLWIRAGVDAGPDGVRLRRDRASQEESAWRMHLHASAPGASFGKDPADKASVPPAYHPGDRELRIVFERAGDKLGRRRVVIGHVNPQNADFQPALIVYDRHPGEEKKGASTVEVWGDFYVRGTAHLSGVQRLSREGEDESEQLDLLLRQLAGPFAGAFRAFLTTDPDWLKQLAVAVAAHIPASPAFITAVTTALVADAGFLANLAGAASGGVAASLAANQGFKDQIRAYVADQLDGDAAFINAVADGVANVLDDRSSFIQAIAGELQTRPAFISAVAAQVRTEVTGDETFRGHVADLAVQRIISDGDYTEALVLAITQWLDQSNTATQDTAVNRLLDALTERLTEDAGRRNSMRNALGVVTPP
jgi:hypothetical protein